MKSNVFFAVRLCSLIFGLVICCGLRSAAQTKIDTGAYKKWEISIDMKPLFNQGPYNLYVARHISPNKSIRVGLSATNFSTRKDTIGPGWLQYAQGITGNLVFTNWVNEYNSFGSAISVGYKYEFPTSNKVSIYLATDFRFEYDEQKTTYLGFIPFHENYYYNIIDNFSQKTINKYLKLSETLGIRYSFNNRVSCSLETSLSVTKALYDFIEKGNGDSVSGIQFTPGKTETSNGFPMPMTHSETNSINFQPFLGLYINYLF